MIDLLNYSDSETEDNELEKEISIAHPRPLWQYQDEDEDLTDEDTSKALNNSKSSLSGLISANELLSSIKEPPAYIRIRKPSDDDLTIYSKETYEKPEMVQPAVIIKEKVISQEKVELVDEILIHNSKSNVKAPKGSQGLKNKSNHPSNKDITKPTAKDRVKRQRESGQSGIGADFKTWRSEEEMRLRQHFDS